MLRAGLGSLVSVVYPPICIACQAATGEAQALCPACWSGMGFIERPYCERLGTPFAVDLGAGLLSPAAIADPPVFARRGPFAASTAWRASWCTASNTAIASNCP